MAVLFLILLYNSPAGLVLYWTLNNVFSLIKHCIKKAKRPSFVFYVMSTAASIGCMCAFVFLNPVNPFTQQPITDGGKKDGFLFYVTHRYVPEAIIKTLLF